MLEPESESAAEEGAPAWMTTFSDMVVLMLCFFVLLLSFARTDTQTFHAALGSVRQALGVKPEPKEAPETNTGAPETATSPATRAATHGSDEERERNAVARVRKFLAERGLEAQVDVSSSRRGVILRTRDQVLFDSGAATLEARGLPVLDAVRGLAEHFQGQLAVEGHTDDQPIQNAAFPSNWELSGARAAAVLRYLLAAGVRPALLHVAGYAETRPVASNESEAGRAQNRRVEFVFEYDAALPEAAP